MARSTSSLFPLAFEISNRSCCSLLRFLLAAVSVYAGTAFAQSPEGPSVETPVPASVVAHFSQLKDYEQHAVYWTAEPGWRTELQLRNNLPARDLTVTPALRAADGQETTLSPVTIKPNDVVSVDLSQVLVQQAPKLIGAYGSVILHYRAPVVRALYAAVMIMVEGRPIEFHLDPFFPQDSWQQGSQESIWWLPRDSVSDYLVLSNTADSKLNAKLILFDSTGKAWQQKLSFAPRQTQRFSVRSLVQHAGLAGSYGGIKIDMASGAGYFDAAHFLFDELGGFSALMKMFDHNPQEGIPQRTLPGMKEWSTRAPMLALSNPDPALRLPAGTTLQPKVFVRNTSGKSFTAQIRFNWWSEAGTGRGKPMELPLKPYETRLLDIAALQSQKVLPSDAHWAAMIISGPMQPNDVIAIAASYDSTGRYGAQTPFSDQLNSSMAAGKWVADSLHDSIITVGNGGIESARAQLTFYYHGGQDKYQVEQTLGPDEQMWLDLGKLIRDQVAGKDGKTIPPEVTSGVYEIKDLSHVVLGPLYEAKLIVDKTNGHAFYGCYECCGNDGADMGVVPVNVFVNGTLGQTVWSVSTCDGGHVNITSAMTSWWTNDTSIATASNAQIHGVAAGSTDNLAEGEISVSGFRVCSQMEGKPSAGTNVFKFVVQGNPYIFVGTDSNIVSANSFFASDGSGGSPKPTGGTVSASSSDSKDTFQITQGNSPVVKVMTPDQSANDLDRALTFTYTVSGTGSVSQKMNVTARQFAYLTNNSPSNQCTLAYGTDRVYTYTVYTHPDKTAIDGSSGLDGTPVTEGFNPALQCDTITGNGSINADGQFTDHVSSGCSSAPLTCTQTTTQSLSVAGIQVRTNTLTSTSTGVTYTSDGPTQ